MIKEVGVGKSHARGLEQFNYFQSKMCRRTKVNRKINPTRKIPKTSWYPASPHTESLHLSRPALSDTPRSTRGGGYIHSYEEDTSESLQLPSPDTPRLLLPACSSLDVKGFGPSDWRDAMKRELLVTEGVGAADSRLRASRDSRRACRPMATSRVPVLAIGASLPIS